MEAIGVSATSCAPNTQQSIQTAPSPATPAAPTRGWSAATVVSRRTARVMTTSSATATATNPTMISFASAPPTESRSVSLPILA